jgi:hypothetical protein
MALLVILAVSASIDLGWTYRRDHHGTTPRVA